jgi:hypothetical protein
MVKLIGKNSRTILEDILFYKNIKERRTKNDHKINSRQHDRRATRKIF